MSYSVSISKCFLKLSDVFALKLISQQNLENEVKIPSSLWAFAFNASWKSFFLLLLCCFVF